MSLMIRGRLRGTLPASKHIPQEARPSSGRDSVTMAGVVVLLDDGCLFLLAATEDTRDAGGAAAETAAEEEESN